MLAAQWIAARVPGGVPIRFRAIPHPFVEDSTLAVSYSGLDSYQACPRQFFYGHVLYVDAPAYGATTILGAKVHQALRLLNQCWLETGAPPSDEEVQEAWRSTWPIDPATIAAAEADPSVRVRWEPGFSFARQVVQGWRRGAAYLRRYYKWERERHVGGATVVPVALEHPFAFSYRGHTFQGRIDCVMRSPGSDLIVDYKTGAKRSDLKAAQSLQLAIYERAWQVDPLAGGSALPAVAYCFLGRGEDRPGHTEPWDTGKQVETARYDEPARQQLWQTIDSCLDRITQNDFAAAPVKGKETCGSCPYKSWCEESLA
jgi:hypothetical protein